MQLAKDINGPAATSLLPAVNVKSMRMWVSLASLAVIIGLALDNGLSAADNDMWWLFATGREIAENGIPYENPFSIYEGQGIIVQQWLPAFIDYLVYDAFGIGGIGVMVSLLTVAYGLCAFSAARGIIGDDGDRGFGLSSLLAVLLVAASTPYLSIRPQVWSMMAYLLVIAVLERYRRSGDWKLLAWLPVISLVHVNVHMSMVPFDVFIAVLYLVNPPFSGRSASFKATGYKRLPLLAAIGAMLVAMCANPYGAYGAAYLALSYSAASYGNYILEMHALSLGDYYGRLMLASIVVGGISLGSNGLRKVDFPLSLLFLVSIPLAAAHTRNVWLVSVFAFALAVSAAGSVKLTTRLRFLADNAVKTAVLAAFAGVVLVGGSVAVATSATGDEADDGTHTPSAAMDYLDQLGADKESTRLMTTFDMGGYVEWRGYKVSMDARPELWNDAIAGYGVDRYAEFVRMSKGELGEEEFLDGKDFDYLVVPTDMDMNRYLRSSSRYALAMSGDGYDLFKAA